MLSRSVDYFARYYRTQADPCLETREPEELFVKQIVDPNIVSDRTWELKYQREQEIRRNQPARTKKKSYDIEL